MTTPEPHVPSFPTATFASPAEQLRAQHLAPQSTAPRLRLVEPNLPSTHPTPTQAAPGSGTAWTRKYRDRLRLSDSIVVIAAVAASAIVSAPSLAAEASAIAGHWAIAALVAALWLVSLAALHTRDTRVLSVGIAEYKRVVSACTMTFGLLAIAFVIVQVDSVRWYFVIALPIGVVALVLGRWIWRRWLLWQGRRGNALSRVIVVGQRADVEYVVAQIAKNSGAAYTVVGAVIDSDGSGIRHGLPDSLPVCYSLDTVASTAERLGADAVVVAGPPVGQGDFIRTLAWDLEGTATALILATNLANIAGPRIHLRPIEGLPLIHVEIPQFEGGKHVLKRAFDIVAAGAALLLLSPVFAALALIVRLDSPGPALFRQERVGRDGNTFTIMKFRSMVTTATADLAGLLDSNNGAGLLFKMKNDPRVTRAGRYLRKYSLDELPQLWNIFIGDMSLVGPRPPLATEVADYETHVHRRLYIRPGLTGMWQVNGRSDLGWEESVQLDLYYVENWSLIGDIVILWRTARVVLKPVGAY
ncbi:Undecaprenyl-phosphate galactose phosphotransferase WbaP/exopolysaccharide biosynthesis polyprenyl glycosylphosphotransferase [Homoserinimonas aerilata]|uniref:Undecaprenyl-phosphate galactose phosphotransferase WbaP/exopolysaccharide biosynthesis polyprenyl glycosylphosphotransferase n=1 Tax=Homoserinimonas aerilata TaxID=1162970 RepID=A0A542Y1P5_9MICO|nr:sugar transferase [Homoserinimonas aerilata]TQL42001.1 Undecaprenyl-phosphate galactose phosphotransferase WbaP/exopolysaccharide biosynthesis polyprenyl glycosylphosphotransferase [Homoserinimonas aerilata]